MTDSNIEVGFKATTAASDATNHGMLLAIWEYARRCGAFKLWEDVKFEMKTVVYSPTEKLKVLFASIVVGCEHTSYLNDKFGGHEKAIAEATLGHERFPDQSQINRLLTSAKDKQVEQWRVAHLQLMAKQSRGRKRKNWTVLSNKQKVLVVDIDQRGISVNGKKFEFAAKGHFSHKRTNCGYQLSAIFLGGKVGEVLDEYFDSGDTTARIRLADLLSTLSWYCKQMNIRPEDVLIRGDAQYGTAATILLIKGYGFHYLFRGLSRARAKTLCDKATQTWWQVKEGSKGDMRWLSDLGECEHLDTSKQGRGRKVLARTICEVSVRVPKAKARKHHCKKRTEEDEKARAIYSYFVTDLSSEPLAVEAVLELYDGRSTIERYFNDEQNALGARHVRTKKFAGAALFQFLVATTSNLLRWSQYNLFGGTKLESLGLKRLIRQVIEIPARLVRRGHKWVVSLPKEHEQVRWLMASFPELETIGVSFASLSG